MKFRVIVLSLTALFCCLAVIALAAADPAQVIYDAHHNNKMVPNPAGLQPGLDVDKAYELQQTVVKMEADENGGIAGWKAGLTGEATQKHFGVPHPVVGALYQSMLLKPGVTVKSSDFQRLFHEVEIALFVNEDVTAPLAGEDAARKVLLKAAPAIEIPDLRFTDMKKITGPDIIADNVGAARVIIGEPFEVSADMLDKIRSRILYNGEEIDAGLAANALGGQFKALTWMSEAVTGIGAKLDKGAFVITGALGKMLPAKPGQYKAEYMDETGKVIAAIEFTVE